MTAFFRINQPGITGGKPPVGAWDTARDDLDLFSVGGTIQLEAQDTSSSYSWELVSEPEGSSVTISNPFSKTASVDIAVTGGYIFRLTVDTGLPTKDISERYVGVPLPNSGLPIPALYETTQDNTRTPSGYERKITELFKWIDTISIGGGVFEEPAGTTVSTRRKDSGATVAGDYNFSAGRVNDIDGASSYCFAYGGAFSDTQQNAIANTNHGVVFGRWNTLDTGDYTFVNGWQNDVYGDYGFCSGEQNTIGDSGGTPNQVTHAYVFGQINFAQADYSYIMGSLNQSYEDQEEVVLLGNSVAAYWPGSMYHAMSDYIGHGFNQQILSHLYGSTSVPGWTDLNLVANGNGRTTLDMEDRTVYLCELRLIARTADAPSSPSQLKTWFVRFTAYRDVDGNATLLSVDKTVISSTALGNETGWDVDVQVDLVPTETPIVVKVLGELSPPTIRWYGALFTTQFRYATAPV